MYSLKGETGQTNWLSFRCTHIHLNDHHGGAASFSMQPVSSRCVTKSVSLVGVKISEQVITARAAKQSWDGVFVPFVPASAAVNILIILVYFSWWRWRFLSLPCHLYGHFIYRNDIFCTNYTSYIFPNSSRQANWKFSSPVILMNVGRHDIYTEKYKKTKSFSECCCFWK